MAPCTKKIALCLLVKGGKSMTNGFLSMTKAKYKKGIRWRAVLKVVGEPARDFGTMYEDPYVSGVEMMENLGSRITTAEKTRVFDMVKEGTLGEEETWLIA